MFYTLENYNVPLDVFLILGHWYELVKLDMEISIGLLTTLGSILLIYLFFFPKKVSCFYFYGQLLL